MFLFYLKFYKKPILYFVLTVMLFAVGFSLENAFLRILPFILGTLCFNSSYMLFELGRAIYAYKNDEDFQVGFTKRHGFGRICMHLGIILSIFVLLAVFFEGVRMQSIFFALLVLLGLSIVLGLHSIDNRLEEGFNQFLKEQEELKKKSEESQE